MKALVGALLVLHAVAPAAPQPGEPPRACAPRDGRCRQFRGNLIRACRARGDTTRECWRPKLQGYLLSQHARGGGGGGTGAALPPDSVPAPGADDELHRRLGTHLVALR